MQISKTKPPYIYMNLHIQIICITSGLFCFGYNYYHSSSNCCGRYLDENSVITNSKERIRETDVLQWAINQRQDSAWVCELNVNFFVNRMIDHPIGCVRTTPFQSTSRRTKPSSVRKRSPTIPRGTKITCVSSDVWPCIEDVIYIDWNRR